MQQDLTDMIADYMEKGFLDNIIDMFRHDTSLYRIIGSLLRDERARVRIGTAALLEELQQERPGEARLAIEHLLPLLKDENPTVRGDAAYLLALVGGREELEALRPLLEDPEPQVALTVKEILDETG